MLPCVSTARRRHAPDGSYRLDTLPLQSDLDYKVVKGRVKPFKKPPWKPEPEKEKPVDAIPPKPSEPGQPWVFPLPLDPTEVAAQVRPPSANSRVYHWQRLAGGHKM